MLGDQRGQLIAQRSNIMLGKNGAQGSSERSVQPVQT